MYKILLFLLFCCSTVGKPPKFKTMGDYYKYYGNKTFGFQTGKYFDDDMPYDQVVHMSNGIIFGKGMAPPSRGKKVLSLNARIPKSFDSRLQWPLCKSIAKIRDQGDYNCTVSWALTVAETITDRICIATKGKMQLELSTNHILSCCTECFKINGCNGGNPFQAWQFWVKEGLVSGGLEFNSNFLGCKPFSKEGRLECKNTCTNKDYNTPLKKDKHFGQRVYKIFPSSTEIEGEIMTSGPVQAIIKIYDDFFLYKNGVYEHVNGDFVGYDTIKLIGWGEENSKKFWLATKIYGNSVGAKGGEIKILRGVDHCGVETKCIAGEVVKPRTIPNDIRNVSAKISLYKLRFLFFIIYMLRYVQN